MVFSLALGSLVAAINSAIVASSSGLQMASSCHRGMLFDISGRCARHR
jgi:hypothetical protein